jgi:hypothetical protein
LIGLLKDVFIRRYSGVIRPLTQPLHLTADQYWRLRRLVTLRRQTRAILQWVSWLRSINGDQHSGFILGRKSKQSLMGPYGLGHPVG